MSRRGSILITVAISLGAVLAIATPAAADENQLTITSFTADYYLDRDQAGRSTLRTVEVIVADFPVWDSNHGLLRELVDDYRGHPTDIRIASITDETGRPLQYEAESNDEYLELRIGDPDAYVHGSHTYVITYTQQNVTLFAGDVEEFYWDTNGVGWSVPFGSVVGRVHIADALADSLNGNSRCYIGFEGSGTECAAPTAQQLDGELVFEVSGRDLPPYANVTIALGFQQGTFEPRDESPWASPYFYLEILAGLAAVFAGVWAIALRLTTFSDARGRPTIIPEYLPPVNATALTSGVVMGRTKRAVAAQLIAMAVEHRIRIIESPATGFFATGSEYTLELLDPTGLKGDEKKLAALFFGSSLTPGAQHTIRKRETALGQAVYKLLQKVKESTVTQGFHKDVSVGARFFPAALGLAGLVGSFIMMVLLFDDARGGLLPISLVIGAFLGTAIVFAVVTRRPLTPAGAELRDYLKGLLLYIKVAETERMRILQSPEGAERSPIDVGDRGQMLRLYERILPFAVLFNEEKRWAKELGDYYDEQPPDWYSGSSAFNSAAFATGISSMSMTSASAYSGSSSSSGGSSGGGSSGGGGGGGGGGGW